MPAAAIASAIARQMLNKVPEVTVAFWVIKVMATTVGENRAAALHRFIAGVPTDRDPPMAR